MITYDTGGIYFVYNLFRIYGSVFPKAFVVSLPNALVCAGFVMCIHDWNMVEAFNAPDFIMNNNAIWGGFSFLVGFLVVFRTSQAYHRFWEGCTQMHKMGAEWFDSCSSLMAFCKHSDADQNEILRFQNLLIRLFSMLHAAALGEIEDCGSTDNYMEVQAFNMELIDAESVDPEALVTIRDCNAKVELIFQWIQQLVVENIKTGVLSIPPPILSRSFQEIATGMVHFHEAMKISNVPFPFPYAQTCDCLLMFHWVLVPFISSQWVTKAWWAGIFSFIQVFTFWTLNLIAVELENPFGTDPNDIDGAQMQLEMNNHLRLLIRPETLKTPALAKEIAQDVGQLTVKAYFPEDGTGSISTEQRGPLSTYHKIWKAMDVPEEAVRRYSTVNLKAGPQRAQKTGRKYTSTSSITASASIAASASSFQVHHHHSGSTVVPQLSPLLSEIEERSSDSKNSQGMPKEPLRQVPASPYTHRVDEPVTQQEHVIPNGQDLLQQGTWEPYLENINGAAPHQKANGAEASPDNPDRNHDAFDNEESTLQIRLGEIFEQIDSGFRPVSNPEWEGRWEDTQEDPRRHMLAIEEETHMTQPPAELLSALSSEPQGGQRACLGCDSDSIQGPAGQPAPILEW